MASKNWLRALYETIGWQGLLPIVVGTPAMIALVLSIWGGLSPIQHIVVAISATLIVFAVVMFIYSQARKVLFAIPSVLYQMYLREREIARPLGVDLLNQENVTEYLQLAGMDISVLPSSVVSVDVLPKILGIAKSQSKVSQETDAEIADRTYRHLGDTTGLNRALTKDKKYQELSSKLNKLMPLVPTTKMSVSITQFLRKTHIFNIHFAISHNLSDEQIKLLPLTDRVDRSRRNEQIDDEILRLLATVRECIIEYYRR